MQDELIMKLIFLHVATCLEKHKRPKSCKQKQILYGGAIKLFGEGVGVCAVFARWVVGWVWGEGVVGGLGEKTGNEEK